MKLNYNYKYSYNNDGDIYQGDINLEVSQDMKNLMNYNEVANKNFKSKVQEYILTIIP